MPADLPFDEPVEELKRELFVAKEAPVEVSTACDLTGSNEPACEKLEAIKNDNSKTGINGESKHDCDAHDTSEIAGVETETPKTCSEKVLEFLDSDIDPLKIWGLYYPAKMALLCVSVYALTERFFWFDYSRNNFLNVIGILVVISK